MDKQKISGRPTATFVSFADKSTGQPIGAVLLETTNIDVASFPSNPEMETMEVGVFYTADQMRSMEYEQG